MPFISVTVIFPGQWAYVWTKQTINVISETNNVRAHICHISTKTSKNMIRDAKKRGVKITCETCPHSALPSKHLPRRQARLEVWVWDLICWYI